MWICWTPERVCWLTFRALALRQPWAVKLALTKGSKRQPTHSLQRLAYPHQPYVDTLYVLEPPRRRRPNLVLTGTSIPLYFKSSICQNNGGPSLLTIIPTWMNSGLSWRIAPGVNLSDDNSSHMPWDALTGPKLYDLQRLSFTQFKAHITSSLAASLDMFAVINIWFSKGCAKFIKWNESLFWILCASQRIQNKPRRYTGVPLLGIMMTVRVKWHWLSGFNDSFQLHRTTGPQDHRTTGPQDHR